MHVADAQREVRVVFAGGLFGQAVSSALWALSAALSTWVHVGWAAVSSEAAPRIVKELA